MIDNRRQRNIQVAFSHLLCINSLIFVLEAYIQKPLTPSSLHGSPNLGFDTGAIFIGMIVRNLLQGPPRPRLRGRDDAKVCL